jgi:DNA-binding LytR/AlgR family response regulator
MCARKLRSIIVDDEPDSIEALEMLLDYIEQVEVLAKTTHVTEVLSLLKNHKPDVVFMDIMMPGLNGIELVKMLKEIDDAVKFVFVSASKEFVREALRLQAFDYLYKPVARDELEVVVNRLCKEKNCFTYEDVLCVPFKKETVYIKPKEIMFLEAHGNYTKIHMNTDETYISSYHLGRFETQVDPEKFRRIGRHAIININYLFKYNKIEKEIVLKDGLVSKKLKCVSNIKL